MAHELDAIGVDCDAQAFVEFVFSGRAAFRARCFFIAVPVVGQLDPKIETDIAGRSHAGPIG